jgi:uncharacterized phage-associated protein
MQKYVIIMVKKNLKHPNKTYKKMTALSVAEYFLFLSKRDRTPITNKKLQKLVYYAQAWALVLRKKPLYNDIIEAWVHGPVIKKVYDKYKKYGFSYIIEPISPSAEKDVDLAIRKLLDNVWSVYGGFDASYLEMLTHSETPWKDARNGLAIHENSDNEITHKAMRTYYAEKLHLAKK